MAMSWFDLASGIDLWSANNSLERTQPQRDIMSGVVLLRRSARGRWAA